jgi:hypothetical protein
MVIAKVSGLHYRVTSDVKNKFISSSSVDALIRAMEYSLAIKIFFKFINSQQLLPNIHLIYIHYISQK